ncbi:metalloprotease TldD [Rouxiella badensis]|uniref:metalloprotease TldD n=1 Tax=Rouxiella badensis TaxID=1646377 RepID=UPI001D141D1E|nr:metalloprotease TldD [Rouxiella badensis]MCC3735720.1 metalloprotease TldD [Rouxiella badensis]MCC3742602.1 metalloprotease TldD [Rouxiella badensis]MCC3761068.1 metalloprotease TldD [Rouxiella badensis]
MNEKIITNHLAQTKQLLLAAHGITDDDLHDMMDLVLSHQVDYADLFVQSLRRENWVMENGVVNSGSFNVDQGFGLRAVEHDTTAFAYSQHIDQKHLHYAARSVKTIAAPGRLSISAPVASPADRLHFIAADPLLACSTEEKIGLLEKINRMTRAVDPRVSQVTASLELNHSVNYILRHDFYQAADIRPMLVLHVSVVVEQRGAKETASTGIGGRGDFSMFNDKALLDALRVMVNTALINLEARAAPSGSMPVVIAAGWPGMLLHEAMGHGFEGDFNRLGTSVYSGRIGERVAQPGINIVDDGTIAGRRGTLNVDDEGEPAKCTTLIEDGILQGYMHDSLSARLMKQSPTGNGRRQSYAHLPMPRMTNTFMRSGRYEPEEIISSVKRGLYLADLGGGQVDIVSGQYSFQSALAYLIEDGKITSPVKGATLTGNGPETLRLISMVGNDLSLDRGTAVCSKSGQNVPVCVGQPTLKIDNIIVG